MEKIKFRQNAVWLLPLLAIITFPLWSIPVGNFLTPRITQHQSAAHLSTTREFQLNGVQITQNQKGRKTAFIIAEKAKSSNDKPNILFMEKVNADIYDIDGKATKITAIDGEYNTSTKYLVLRGEVIVRKIADDQTLYTDLLIYSDTGQTVFCPNKTKIVAPDATINSGNLLYFIKEFRYELGGGVRCTLTNFDNGA